MLFYIQYILYYILYTLKLKTSKSKILVRSFLSYILKDNFFVQHRTQFIALIHILMWTMKILIAFLERD